MNITTICNKIIEYSFYALFLLVPLVFVGDTSELFELNKMWLTYGLTILITGSWITAMIAKKQIRITKTPFDIFLILFLLSQLVSSIISLDSRVSFWGYYSRFNGGFYSILCYVILFYAFVTHFSRKQTMRLLIVTLISGFLVVLWGLPSHFGYDPTCYVFRGTLDVSCWTDAFKPTIRIFSTLGQPAWLAAYMAVLLPLSMSMFLRYFESKLKPDGKIYESKGILILHSSYFILTILFYLSLLFTGTRAGFFGFWSANLVFWTFIFFKHIFSIKHFLIFFFVINGIFVALNFLAGTPIAQLNKFTLSALTAKSQTQQTPTQTNPTPDSYNPTITNSGDIRVHVWKGAIEAWKANPIFGTGLETFAYAYYQHRPSEHNLTSEWDYLYNKAHNEFLNYLTTSGIVGLGTYLLFLGLFVLLMLGTWFHRLMASLLKVNSEAIKSWDSNPSTLLLTTGLFSGWISIWVTNFFGFSVVIINLFLILIPAFVFILAGLHQEKTAYLFPKEASKSSAISVVQWLGISIVTVIGLWWLYGLFQFWNADKSYALGYNLARSGEYQSAYNPLKDAHQMVPAEPVFTDELSAVSSQVALLFYQQQDATSAAEFAQQAIDLNNEVLTTHANSLVFWKTRIRIFYTLGQVDGRYLTYALQAAIQAAKLAPTDAKVSYNLGVLYGQTGNPQKGTEILQQTIRLKPDYIDAYYAIGLFYRDLAVDKDGNVVNPDMQQRAEKAVRYILENIDPENEQAKKTLQEWDAS